MDAPEQFSLSIDVKWSDCDPNRHLRHSAYADYATHVRLAYLEHKGFGANRFVEEGFGAVIVREETQYLREIELHEKITVDFKVIAFSEDWCRWTVMHEFKKQNGKRAALVSIDGLWLDMHTRKMRPPPADLKAIMESLPVGKVPAYKRFLS